MDLTLYANCVAAERAPRVTALTFPDILSDPLVRLIMKADKVDPKALETRTCGTSRPRCAAPKDRPLAPDPRLP